MLNTLKMALTKHILMIQKPGILHLDLKAQLKQNGYTTSYLNTIFHMWDMTDIHIPDLIILDTDTIREEPEAYLKQQHLTFFDKLESESLIHKNDVLLLDNKMSVIAGFSIPFDTGLLINKLKDYAGLQEDLA